MAFVLLLTLIFPQKCAQGLLVAELSLPRCVVTLADLTCLTSAPESSTPTPGIIPCSLSSLKNHQLTSKIMVKSSDGISMDFLAFRGSLRYKCRSAVRQFASSAECKLCRSTRHGLPHAPHPATLRFAAGTGEYRHPHAWHGRRQPLADAASCQQHQKSKEPREAHRIPVEGRGNERNH